MRLKVNFFNRDTVIVAKELLGKYLCRKIGNKVVRVKITETEAYCGIKDKACHASKGLTPRTKIMFGHPGYAYVYMIYGMYYCINFTTEIVGQPGAVLIRAVEPLSGVAEMKKRRKTDKIINLCSGPGKLCSALGIGKKHNGLKLGKEIKVFDDGSKVGKIRTSSRIGIKDALDLQWRFFVEGNEWVS